jgi:glycerophosphoryl diester phosphodiesterase
MTSLEPNVPFVIGHRGAAGLAPENTLISLRRARMEGAKWVEFDVKLTGDGIPILFHDDTLNRTTSGKGPVKDCPFERIRKLEAGAWFGASFAGARVPTFDEAIQTLAAEGLGANVEIKPNPGEARATAEAVCNAIAETWPESVPDPVISSFDRDAMAVTRDMLPDTERAILFHGLPKDWKRIAAELGCRAVHASNRQMTETLAAQVIAAGLHLRVFTVNDPVRAETLRQWGVSAVFTDRPDLIKDPAT